MTMQVHPNYARLVDLARESHEKGRTPAEITPEDVALARLYSYAFRGHTIGAFHATRLAIDEIEMCDPLTEAHRKRAVELLIDLANQTMDVVEADFRALISTFYRYATNIPRVIESLSEGVETCQLESMRKVRDRFTELMEEISQRQRHSYDAGYARPRASQFHRAKSRYHDRATRLRGLSFVESGVS